MIHTFINHNKLDLKTPTYQKVQKVQKAIDDIT